MKHATVQRASENKVYVFARETSAIVDIIKRHFLKLVIAWEGRKEKVETIIGSKENDYACSKVENITQFVIVYTPECLMCW